MKVCSKNTFITVEADLPPPPPLKHEPVTDSFPPVRNMHVPFFGEEDEEGADDSTLAPTPRHECDSEDPATQHEALSAECDRDSIATLDPVDAGHAESTSEEEYHQGYEAGDQERPWVQYSYGQEYWQEMQEQPFVHGTFGFLAFPMIMAPGVLHEGSAAAAPSSPTNPTEPRVTDEEACRDKLTTVMLRNLPNDYDRPMLEELLNAHDLAGKYDFLYLPADFRRFCGLGYAFANFATHEAAQEARRILDGFKEWSVPGSAKVCRTSWGSREFQGRSRNIERYRNSPVMHPQIEDRHKPAIYSAGARADFPAPTRKIRAPRSKRSRDPRFQPQQ